MMTIQNPIPVLHLRDGVLFPGQVLPVMVSDTKTMRTVEAARSSDGMIFVVAVRPGKEYRESDPVENLHKIGVLARLGLVQRDGKGMSMVLRGKVRAHAARYHASDSILRATVTPLEEMQPIDERDPAFVALFKELRERSRELGKLYEIPPEAIQQVVDADIAPGKFADQLTGMLDLSVAAKQRMLEMLDVDRRMREMLVVVQERIGVLLAQQKIKSQVEKQLGGRQKEMYLREQLKAIKRELGEGTEGEADEDELAKRLEALELAPQVRKEVDRELNRLSRTSQDSPEAQVIRTYLEWIAELPWNERSQDNLDLGRADEILNEDHYGLKDVKDRILEFLAVRKLRSRQAEEKTNPSAHGPILLFTGPPGVGKTSIAKSIARSLGREYVRIALGGTRDEAEIRGHRRTYIGAMPGRIIHGLKQAGTKNPVILLDEIDKLGASFQGDPASALMEVLDPAQNESFVDRYLNVPFDLSEVLFIATANFVQGIPGPLLDRMEMVEFSGYTEQEKVQIAKGYLIPRQLEEAGLSSDEVEFDDDTVAHIVGKYTRESGVRQLEREIGKVLRKAAREIAKNLSQVSDAGDDDGVTLTEERLRQLLGRPKVRQEQARKENDVGVATGMYYTPMGGDIMFVETSVRELSGASRSGEESSDSLGSVALILTGQLGDVMKESARAALTYATTHAAELGIPARHLGSLETHIHVPAGAIPKDGPSAGVTIATALASALSGRPVRKDVAMTGETSLLGQVLPIGGIKEKVLGAHRAGIDEIILPRANRDDLEDIPDEIQQSLTFHFVDTLDEVLQVALMPAIRIPYSNRGQLTTATGFQIHT